MEWAFQLEIAKIATSNQSRFHDVTDLRIITGDVRLELSSMIAKGLIVR